MAEPTSNQSRPESLSRFLLLSIVTFGMYQWYWGWRTWALVRHLEHRKFNATLWSAFLGFTLFSALASLNKFLKQAPGKQQIYAVLYLLVSITPLGAGALYPFSGWSLLVLYLLLGLAVGLVLIPVHQTVEAVWEQAAPPPNVAGLKRNTKLIVAISIFELMSLLGLLMPAPNY